jgi:hypothetical protein
VTVLAACSNDDPAASTAVTDTSLESVGPGDPMTKHLAANKRFEEIHSDDRDGAPRPVIEEQFVVAREETPPGGTRALLLLQPK